MGEICLFCTIAICYCIYHKVKTLKLHSSDYTKTPEARSTIFGLWLSQAALLNRLNGLTLHTMVQLEDQATICPHLPQTAKSVGPYEAAALQYLEGLELVFVASLVPSTRRVTQCTVQDIFWTIRWNPLRAFSVRRDQSSESSNQTHSIVSLSYVTRHFNEKRSKLRNLCQDPDLNFPTLLS